MPTLTLKFKDNILETFELEKGKSLTIGRRDGNDVVVENLAVSGHHAKIDTVGEGFVITDLKSKNGTFINEQMVASHWLVHGDQISIGKHSLTFLYDDSEARPKPPREKMEQTMVMDTGQYRDMLAKSEHLETLKASRGLAVLSFLTGGEGEFELSKKLIKLGKDNSNDIVIKGLGVGKTCATISRRPDGYYLSYVGGMARLKCNGESIKQSVLLTEFDEIQIGSARMQFVTKDPVPAPPAATAPAAPAKPAKAEEPEPPAQPEEPAEE